MWWIFFYFSIITNQFSTRTTTASSINIEIPNLNNFIYLVNNIYSSKHYIWTRSSRTLVGKLNKHGNDRDIKNFYWKDLKKNLIKTKLYDDYNFEKTLEYLKLCYEYSEYSYGFY